MSTRPVITFSFYWHSHSLNMEVDLQSYWGSMSRDVHSCTHWLRPRNSPPPPHLDSYYEGLLVSKDRRHLFVTTWPQCSVSEYYWKFPGSLLLSSRDSWIFCAKNSTQNSIIITTRTVVVTQREEKIRVREKCLPLTVFSLMGEWSRFQGQPNKGRLLYHSRPMLR